MRDRRNTVTLRAWRSLALPGILLLTLLTLVACASEAETDPADDAQSAAPAPASGQTGDASEQMRDCLEKRGFAVSVGADGGMEIKSPEPSVTPREGIAACQEELQKQGVVPDPGAPQSRADMEQRYTFLVGVNDCMKRRSYPTAEPPSLDVFVEGGGLWHPYDAIFGGPAGPDGLSAKPAVDLGTVQRECPDH